MNTTYSQLDLIFSLCVMKQWKYHDVCKGDDIINLKSISIAVEKHAIVIVVEWQNAIPLIHVIDQMYMYILLYKLIVDCPWPDRGY